VWKRAVTDNTSRCSFCRKSEDVVGKLISSPSDYPRAFICDECIAVCNFILEEDKSDQPSPTEGDIAEPLDVKEVLVQSVIGEDVPVDISDDLYKQAQAIAVARQVSFSELIAGALSEYFATWDRLQRKAAEASREAFLQVLDEAPDDEPAEYDRL
jgi:hypothetical protein